MVEGGLTTGAATERGLFASCCTASGTGSAAAAVIKQPCSSVAHAHHAVRTVNSSVGGATVRTHTHAAYSLQHGLRAVAGNSRTRKHNRVSAPLPPPPPTVGLGVGGTLDVSGVGRRRCSVSNVTLQPSSAPPRYHADQSRRTTINTDVTNTNRLLNTD